MKAVFIIIFLAVASFIQLRKLLKNGQKKDAIVYSSLMVIAAYLSLGMVLDFYIPNPTNGLRLLFQPIEMWIQKVLS